MKKFRYILDSDFNSESDKSSGRAIKALKEKGTLLNDRVKIRIHGGGRLMVRKKINTLKIRRKDYNPKSPGDLIQMLWTLTKN